VPVLPAEVLSHRKGCAAGCCVGVSTPCITFTPCPCQSAGDQLSQELKRVKNELEQVKGELGTWGWLFWGAVGHPQCHLELRGDGDGFLFGGRVGSQLLPQRVWG